VKTKRTSPLTTDGPRPGDHVELVDPSTGRPLRAAIEELATDRLLVRFRSASRLRGRTRLRWFDGEQAWECAAAVHAAPQQLDRADVEVLEGWQAVPARGSERVSVDRFPVLLEVVHSNINAKGRRFDLLCQDVSATGCAATAAGRGPAHGDLVRVAWVRGDEFARIAPEWIDAHVVRAEARPFGGGAIGLRFEPADEVAHARILAWRDAWAGEAASRATDLGIAIAAPEIEPEGDEEPEASPEAAAV
jgi:hypothetical protein